MIVCGIDEVGRGALAGPLLAVAALVNTGRLSYEMVHCPIVGVDDSKKLTAKKRDRAFDRILHNEALIDFGIGEVSPEEIDERGMGWANEMVFMRAFKDLNRNCELVLIDGEIPLMDYSIEKQMIKPKADSLWWPVGTASILAKVIRDRYMAELGKDYPEYLWKKNAGYGSDDHYIAIRELGISKWHRKRFLKGVYERS